MFNFNFNYKTVWSGLIHFFIIRILSGRNLVASTRRTVMSDSETINSINSMGSKCSGNSSCDAHKLRNVATCAIASSGSFRQTMEQTRRIIPSPILARTNWQCDVQDAKTLLQVPNLTSLTDRARTNPHECPSASTFAGKA